MMLPPFPSQDLAKLVLGYLAEEQLMTAYDEFLQASPYLDALRNEYDRIFMTSLKNILAEYRAVKIYVETCKPLVLRKKLVQCTNLLDVVKLLANYVDVNKILAQDTSSDKISLVKQNISKQSVCEVCSSLSLSGCACKSKQKSSNSASYVETNSLDTSVETTALEDLPGNHVTNRKKQVRMLEKESASNVTSESNIQSSNVLNISGNGLNTVNPNTHCSHMKLNETSALTLSSITKVTDTPECREKIEEFNTILNKVCKNKSQAEKRLYSLSESDNLNKSIPNANTFQDFASGVGGHENRNDPVPDSSTSENLTALSSVAKDINRDIGNNLNVLANISDVIPESGQYHNYPYPKIKPRCQDQKIKIISDIKVDKPFPAINNATSTPLMQTIVINGTPAYKQKLPVGSNNYTKDEIMAMPTIIVVPASGGGPHLKQSKPVLAQKLQKAKPKPISSGNLLGPLVIDISSSTVAEKTDVVEPNVDKQNSKKETGLVNTVEVAKNASVPKDNVIAGSFQTNTPQVLPPVRKSSSTPRRNSHIRVLDFTTPRRILHETINEVVPNETSDRPVEIVVTASPNVVLPNTGNEVNNIVDMSNVKVHKIETSHYNSLTKDNENKQQLKKKNNWDADLRALAIAGGVANEQKSQPTKSKPKPRKPKNKKSEINSELEKTDKIDQKSDKKEGDKTDDPVEKKPRSKRKISPKPKKSKKRRKLEEEEEQYEQSADSTESKGTVKPTFNIVAAYSTRPEDKKGNENQQNKSDAEEVNETPEAERLSLHNEIGARLNISEFLETPYKQVLYDIQMETPKFLGSVLPDEPISDIKIMNIPTPRFFDTPKPALATPSSYSSRPTDYSSGGSYYKPDEQDYLRIPDLECPVTSSKEELHLEVPKEKDCPANNRSTRPVRKCTKNVSYVSCSTVNKTKEKQEKTVDDKIEIASSCSDTTSGNSSFEKNKEVTLKTPKSHKAKLISKSETKKKLDSNKKRKSPMNKDKLSSFMKIKPRRPTPTKDTSNKRTRRKTDMFSQNVSSKSQSKKKVNAKEKNIHITPIITPAPTKSRRKSSTPRKLHCTKIFNSESSGHESPDINVCDNRKVSRDQSVVVTVSSHDSDTEQIALRWSDDGSQDSKQKEVESEDISKIQEYIQTSINDKTDYKDNSGHLHVDLIKRGFDAETAKIIERDLLDTPPYTEPISHNKVEVTESKKDEGLLDKSIETDTSAANELQIVQDDESEDELELSAYECNQEGDNYITCYSETKDRSEQQPIKLKDKFSMEVCIDDGVAIRLRATDFNMLFSNDQDNDEELGYSFRETEVAVRSISNMDKLYTPLKEHKAQCFEIFDSTLTSLDTPLKVNSPRQKITEIEIVLEEERLDGKDKADMKRRKRLQSSGSSSEEALKESKKTKPEAQYLFNSTNIQNIDIESVLKKLHGP